MSAPVLTKKEQKKSLSGIKNRKKAQKNVLAAPDIVKIRNPVVNETCIPEIISTLELLLPNARLPQDKVSKKSKSVETTEKSDDTSMTAGLKRNQLLLGVNSISRGVSSESVACVLFADDVKPKLLISHLIVLCSLKNIPYLYMKDLRGLTEKTLGFSCIALGVKKNSTFFSPLIKLMMSATKIQQNDNSVQTIVENIESSTVNDDLEKNETSERTEKTFTYLYRDFNTKRVFVPDSSDTKQKEDGTNFIAFEPEEEVTKSVPKTFTKKISGGKTFNLKKNVIIEKQVNSGKSNTGKYNFSVEYSPTQIIKMGSNPKRENKKFVKMKKRKELSCLKKNQIT